MAVDTREQRLAVVLFNLGGPDRPEAVRPFLFNLFNDPAILRVPGLFRMLLAAVLSGRRARAARDIYARIGGCSPLLENTQAQAQALQTRLSDAGSSVRVFVAMRYWHPFSAETAAEVQVFAPDRVILLPLYPQWSTTTTASSLRAWNEACRTVGLDVPTTALCCYPTGSGFVEAMADLIRPVYAQASRYGRPRVLFSAHGLPQRVVAAGDPYQWQCERTAEAIVAVLGLDDLDWVNCYQSRVGPLAWIGPATDDELRRAGTDHVPVVVVPIAFVSEHSETLVELDMEYRHLAEGCGVPYFGRVATVGTHPAFVADLAGLVEETAASGHAIFCPSNGRQCPVNFSGCAHRR